MHLSVYIVIEFLVNICIHFLDDIFYATDHTECIAISYPLLISVKRFLYKYPLNSHRKVIM